MLYKELYRPQYHFTAPQGWLNDPNGLVWYKGEYHLFYQHYPDDVFWGPMHWGHAVSKDLIHWENLPIALYPDDNGTIFSGSIIVDKNNDSGLFESGEGLIAFYTGHIDRPNQHPIEHQCVAYSEDCGRSWKMYKGNPVITPPDTPDAYDFRDPKVFWHEESSKWIMFLGGGFYRVYSSSNLLDWKLESESLIFEEFPDIAQIKVENSNESKWVLNLAGFTYYVGSFDGKQFIREEGPYVADYAQGCQATQTFSNLPDDRVIMISWMRDGSRGPTSPWRNSMTVARELTLRKMEDGTHRLIQRPVREISVIEKKRLSKKDVVLKPHENILEGVHGTTVEIDAVMIPEKTGKVTFRFLMNENQYTQLVADLDNGLYFLDYTAGNTPKWRHTQTSFDNAYFLSPEPIKMRGKCFTAPISNKNEIRMKALIDRTSVEIFLEDGLVSFTFCVFPDDEADELSLTADCGMKIKELTVTDMEGIW
ncbi:MAG: glycoside hydrolase family 32 protein [Erysipelotrichaceae bacterium]|nr:glycoside hydrolase family 32 protein [Erysipelotrichaceae bacterium]